jgi:ABC-type transport system involved in cytochrome c biogenesis permease subunit
VTVPVSVAATLEVSIADQSAWIKIVGGVLVLLVAIFLFSGIIKLLGAVAGVYVLATGVRELRQKRQ